mmetsp:Transcript_86817/g.149808  ORF Transcript_86817/g.149808 Transcript_86817/m.149808 type:complete len:285 (+) Transcript_86817:65-919(+)
MGCGCCYGASLSPAWSTLGIKAWNSNEHETLSEKLGEPNLTVPGKIADVQITASSTFSRSTLPYTARLHAWGARWCPAWGRARDSWIQVDLGRLCSVSGVATQGNGWFAEWTTGYKLSYSLDGDAWMEHPTTFQGNCDRQTVVKHAIEEPFQCRYVRLCPKTWVSFGQVNGGDGPCIRFDLYTMGKARMISLSEEGAEIVGRALSGKEFFRTDTRGGATTHAGSLRQQIADCLRVHPARLTLFNGHLPMVDSDSIDDVNAVVLKQLITEAEEAQQNPVEPAQLE